ncbi:MAG: nucleotide exchange factor GrpE [Bacteroidetes bacterium]|nr:nucleotide exchange factor GrpE [Bacteroidota bacterium]
MTKKQKDTKVEDKEKKSTQQEKKQSKKEKTEKKEVKAEEPQEEVKEEKKAEKTDKEKFEEINDKYLRLAAEYDNYRKRTLKERMELTKSAGEDILVNILPVMDDFERALGSIDQAKDINAVKEGIQLIYNKFKEFLKQKGVKEIDAKEKEFDTDLHEAITKIPAPDEKLKGKVVDVIEKGYYLNDKVIRFSKVVIGE